jgi:negative regulator of flagellin synthesis FlgM
MDVKRVGHNATQVTDNKATENKGVDKARAHRLGTTKISDPATGLTSSTPGSEKVEWSDDAQMAREAFQVAKNTPDVRKDKVAALKAAIKNGTYKVDNQKVAESMLQESLEESIITGQS